MYCNKCGSWVDENQKFCNKCGSNQGNRQITNNNSVKCPHCGSGSINFTPVTTTSTNTTGKTKGFGTIKSCLGLILFGWIGILCGLCGMGKGRTKTTTQTDTKVIRVCQNCGYRF